MVAQEELFKPGHSHALRKPFSTQVVLLGSVGFLLLMVFLSLRTVPPAHVGLVITFGFVSDSVMGAGLHICNPLAEVKLFSTKTNLLEQRNHVPTKEGLTVDLDVAMLYHVEQARVREIFFGLGENFASVAIEPELSSAVRGLTGEADAKALYTSGRSEIQRKLKAELTAALAPRGIVLEDVLLKAVILPQQLVDSIELKAKAEQDAGRMEFVLQKERLEADRKGIEAKGIATFQRIVSEGISPALLQWKGIEATEKLSESRNSKIVIMGNSKESLPVILSGDVMLASGSEVVADASAKNSAHLSLRGGQ